MDDRSVSLNYYLSKEYRDPPKAFWKYYDLYRRKQITLDEYAVMTGLAPSAICRYLAAITEKKLWGDRIFEKCGIRRDEGGDGGKTLEIRGKRRLSARDGGANYQQS